MKKIIITVLSLLIFSLFLSACQPATPAQPAPASSAKLPVVATTTIVADVVRQVGGDKIELTTLLPVGADPHSFEARPQDAAALSNATLVFANGAHLEEFLDALLQSANATDKLVEVSEGITLLEMEADDHEGETHEGEGEDHEHEGGDPHTWTDPNNVMIWTENIAAALSQADPANAEFYRANADAYLSELKALDAWVREQVSQILPENRKLVTDHRAWGYFADEYGFEQIGALVGSFSTVAQTSSQDLAALEDTIRAQGVKAVFVGRTVNPQLAEQVAKDTGIQVVYLYTGSLTAPDGDAPDYLRFIRYNVTAMVTALK